MSKASIINIAVEIDDKGTVKLRKIGDESEKAGKKGEKGMARMRKGIADLDNSTQLSISSLTNLAKITFTAILAGLAALTFGLIKSLGAASDLEEVSSKFGVVFADQMGKAEAWSTELVNGYAMSTREAKQYLSSVQDLLVPMGMASGAAGEMSMGVTTLAADLGSFNNLPTAQVMDDIQSALVGNYETMKKYGVVINASTVEQQALNMGLAGTKSELTAAHKAQAAYQMMVEGSTAAIGDMGRTFDGYANQLKQSRAITEDLAAALGKRLLPVAADVLKEINAGMKEGAGGVDALATSLSVKLLQGLGLVIETMRFFHNGWLGIKLVGTLAIDAIAQSLEFLFGGLRKLMTPLDLLFEGAKKLGAIDVNPFDGVEEALGTFATSSRDVTKEVLADIERTNAGYDKAKAVISGYVDMVKNTDVSDQTTATETLTAATEELSNAIEAGGITWQEVAKAKHDGMQLGITDMFMGLDAANERSAGMINAAKKESEAVRKSAADQANAYRNMYSDLDEYAEDHFDLQVDLLNKEAQKYKDLGVAEQLVNAWRERKHEELYDDYLLTTDSFIAGVAVGWKQMLRDQDSWADAGLDIFDTFIVGATDALSSNLFDVMKGDFDDLGEVWKGLWDTMLGTMTDILAEMLIQWAAAKIGDFVTSYFHEGTLEIKEDEVPAILQKGEMVIPAEQAGRIRENLSYSGGAEQGAFDKMAQESRDMGYDMTGFGENLGREFAMDAVAASVGVASGATVGNMLDALTHTMTSVNNIAFAASATLAETMGFNTTPGDIGFSVGAMTAAALGLSGPIGAIAALAGAVGVEALADAFDMREFEPFLDSMEDANGFFGSHAAMAGTHTAAEIYDMVSSAGALDSFGDALEEIAMDIVESAADGSAANGSDMGDVGSDMGNTGGMGGSIGDSDGDMAARFGGVFSGPSTGYPVTLHGTEAVVPLRDGNIPVDLSRAEDDRLLAEVRRLIAVVERGNYYNLKNSKKMAQIISGWNKIGIPAERVVA
jgi:hypothetical protein